MGEGPDVKYLLSFTFCGGIPHPLHYAELHVSDTMLGLCKVSRDWCCINCIEFLNTSVMFIHPLSDRSFGLSNVLETAFIAIDYIYHITQFTCVFVLWWEVNTLEDFLRLKASDLF